MTVYSLFTFKFADVPTVLLVIFNKLFRFKFILFYSMISMQVFTKISLTIEAISNFLFLLFVIYP